MSECKDLIFELGTEELPPTALKKLSAALTSEFLSGLDKAGLTHGAVESFAAPRRLALIVRDCALSQPDQSIEKRGPALNAAFKADGSPTPAAEGFARSCGVSMEQLGRIKTDKGEWLGYVVNERGKPASALLPGIAEQALNALPIPKRMRWGAGEAQFVRPVHWLLFLHGDAIVPCTILDAKASNSTRGHRFHHPQEVEIRGASDYESALETTGKVIANFAKRRERVRSQIEKSAEALGAKVHWDEELLDEVTALNEWPVPISASFEEQFLQVPNEALILTMKKNQKYFPLFDANGQLLNHFITIANIDSPKPELIAEGNERVVRPRLSDAMFFWQQDGKHRLEARIEKLKTVVFQQKLGSMYEKSVRVAQLAGHIAAQIGVDQTQAERAGMLSRCDLMTEMVGEFAAMQGIMGRYLAQKDGEPGDIAQAMDEFYMPRQAGDKLPQTGIGICISLAEKLDTLVGIFGIGLKPTGDKDPFALRRAALGALRILREHQLNLDVRGLISFAQSGLGQLVENSAVGQEVYAFLLERLKGLLGEDVRLFDAVAAVSPASITDFDQRVEAVRAFQQLPEAEALAAANKRIRNILKKLEGTVPTQVNPELFSEPAERELAQQVADKARQLAPLIAERNYQAALAGLAGLRSAVDEFFDQVMVMSEDPLIRDNRLALLGQLNGLFMSVADISLLQG